MREKKTHPHLRLYVPEEPLYPNAADRSYFANKALDIASGLVSGLGFVSAMLFLLTL